MMFLRHCEGLPEAINRIGILFGIRYSLIATLALLARNDTKTESSIAHHVSVPATARNVYVRAARHNIDAALWNMT